MRYAGDFDLTCERSDWKKLRTFGEDSSAKKALGIVGSKFRANFGNFVSKFAPFFRKLRAAEWQC